MPAFICEGDSNIEILTRTRKLLLVLVNDFDTVDDQLLFSIHNLFAAGSLTTAATLMWAMNLFGLFPEVQEKVHAEMDAKIGRNRQITMADRGIDTSTANCNNYHLENLFECFHWKQLDCYYHLLFFSAGVLTYTEAALHDIHAASSFGWSTKPRTNQLRTHDY